MTQRAHLLAPQLAAVAGGDGRRLAQRGRDQPERRAGGDGVAAPDEDLQVGVPAPQPLGDLVAQARLAAARRRGHQHRARHRLVDALVERAFEQRELAVAADARRGLAEQRARHVVAAVLAHEVASIARALELEARAQEIGGHRVEADLAAGLAAQELGAAVDHVADGELAEDHGAPGADGHRHLGQRRAQPQRAARGVRRLVGGRAPARQRHDHRAVEQAVDARAVRHQRRAQPLEVGLVERAVGRQHDSLLGGAPGICLGAARPGLGPRIGRRRRVGQRQLLPRPRPGHEHDADHSLLARGQRVARRAHHRGRRAPRRVARRRIEPLADRGQLRLDRRGVARARVALLGEHVGQRRFEVRGQPGAELADRERLVEADLREHRHGRRAGERRLAGQALDHHAPEREQVGARVDLLLAARLLGRHVHRRAHDAAGLGDAARIEEAAREPEVEQLRLLEAAAGQEEVARLDVAVDDAAPVRAGQRVGDAAAEVDALADGQRPAGQAVRQVLALEPLHRQVVLAERRRAVRDVAHDRGVAELGQHLGLLAEAVGLLGAAPVQDLERHQRAGLPVERTVDRRRSARTHLALQLEAIERSGG